LTATQCANYARNAGRTIAAVNGVISAGLTNIPVNERRHAPMQIACGLSALRPSVRGSAYETRTAEGREFLARGRRGRTRAVHRCARECATLYLYLARARVIFFKITPRFLRDPRVSRRVPMPSSSTRIKRSRVFEAAQSASTIRSVRSNYAVDYLIEPVDISVIVVVIVVVVVGSRLICLLARLSEKPLPEKLIKARARKVCQLARRSIDRGGANRKFPFGRRLAAHSLRKYRVGAFISCLMTSRADDVARRLISGIRSRFQFRRRAECIGKATCGAISFRRFLSSCRSSC